MQFDIFEHFALTVVVFGMATLRNEQNHKVHLITKSITQNILYDLSSSNELDISLFAGDFGKIVYLFYASKHNLISTAKAQMYLQKLFKTFNNYARHATYCNGLAGFCIGLELLEEDGFISGAIKAVPSCYKMLSVGLKHYIEYDLDFLHGAIGIGIFFVRHMHNSEFASNQVDIIVNKLFSNAQRLNNNQIRILYRTSSGQYKPNLSLSHGISSTAVFLTRVYKKTNNPSTKTKCTFLLNGIVNYLIGQLINPHIYGSFTAAHPIEEDFFTHKSRLAWCYGDIGIATALNDIGNVFNNPYYKFLSKTITNFIIINRLDAYNNYVYDGGICHGASGIIQYLRSRSYDCSIAIQYWLTILLNMTRQQKDLYYFGKYSPNSETIIPCLNLLEGDAGIGLTLLKENKFLNTILLYNEGL